MAHQLMNNNAMFSVGETPWHKLGTILDSPPNTAQALIEAKLNWEVKSGPMYLNDGTEVKGELCNYRTENGKRITLGIVSPKYEILQNAEAFAPFDEALIGMGWTYETAGAIRDGRRIWVLAKAPDNGDVGNGDIINNYGLLMNSHDGSTKVKFMPTNVRVVCNNTLSFALSRGDNIAIKHTKGVKARLDEVTKVIKTTNGNLQEAMYNYKRFKDLKKFDIVKYFESIEPRLTKRNDIEYNPVTKRKVPNKWKPMYESLRNKFQYGLGNKGESLWDGYNAVTEHVDYSKELGDKWINSNVFGHGAQLKAKAYRKAVDLVNQQVMVGHDGELSNLDTILN